MSWQERGGQGQQVWYIGVKTKTTDSCTRREWDSVRAGYIFGFFRILKVYRNVYVGGRHSRTRYYTFSGRKPNS